MDRWSGRWGRVGRKDLVECLATSSCSGTLHKDFHGTYLSKQTISRFRSMVKWTLNKLDMGSPLSSTYLAFDWIVVINYNYASKTQFPGPPFPLFASFHRRSHSATRNPTNLTQPPAHLCLDVGHSGTVFQDLLQCHRCLHNQCQDWYKW